MTGHPPNGQTIEGIVTPRPCGCCGHHEIGIVTRTGDYVSLRPGMQVKIIVPVGRPAAVDDLQRDLMRTAPVSNQPVRNKK